MATIKFIVILNCRVRSKEELSTRSALLAPQDFLSNKNFKMFVMDCKLKSLLFVIFVRLHMVASPLDLLFKGFKPVTSMG